MTPSAHAALPVLLPSAHTGHSVLCHFSRCHRRQWPHKYPPPHAADLSIKPGSKRGNVAPAGRSCPRSIEQGEGRRAQRSSAVHTAPPCVDHPGSARLEWAGRVELGAAALGNCVRHWHKGTDSALVRRRRHSSALHSVHRSALPSAAWHVPRLDDDDVATTSLPPLPTVIHPKRLIPRHHIGPSPATSSAHSLVAS